MSHSHRLIDHRSNIIMNSGSGHWQSLSPIHSLGPVIETCRASTLSTKRCEAHPNSRVIDEVDSTEGQRLFPCRLASDARTRIDPVGISPLRAFPSSNFSRADMNQVIDYSISTSPSYLGTDSTSHSHSQPIDNDEPRPDFFSFAIETSNPVMEVKGKSPLYAFG
ncbi:hypothetical protein M422DRAFT_245301 [Sphaerobolus stellatus SS14]|nr:hypothetical protein M422DRAFT_245301 [Sphaerobolus stellatus SS14]